MSLELKPGATIQIDLRKGEFLLYPYENLWNLSGRSDSIQGTILHVSAVSIVLHPLEERYTGAAYAVFLSLTKEESIRHGQVEGVCREKYNFSRADIASEVRKRAMIVQNILFTDIESFTPLEPQEGSLRDTELLNFLQTLTDERQYTGKVILRASTTGRGWRLHESSDVNAVSDVRTAIINYKGEKE